MLLHLLVHGVVQTHELETDNVPQRTTSNVYFLLSCYPNSFTDLDFSMLVDVLCITIPDTGCDSRVMQGEVDGCISLALPAIDLEQSQHFSDMPPLMISTGHCPEM